MPCKESSVYFVGTFSVSCSAVEILEKASNFNCRTRMSTRALYFYLHKCKLRLQWKRSQENSPSVQRKGGNFLTFGSPSSSLGATSRHLIPKKGRGEGGKGNGKCTMRNTYADREGGRRKELNFPPGTGAMSYGRCN